MAEREDIYDPSTPEVNRNIQQGGGVGARDLARQDEPDETTPAEDADETPTEPMGRAHPVD